MFFFSLCDSSRVTYSWNQLIYVLVRRFVFMIVISFFIFVCEWVPLFYIDIAFGALLANNLKLHRFDVVAAHNLLTNLHLSFFYELLSNLPLLKWWELTFSAGFSAPKTFVNQFNSSSVVELNLCWLMKRSNSLIMTCWLIVSPIRTIMFVKRLSENHSRPFRRLTISFTDNTWVTSILSPLSVWFV